MLEPVCSRGVTVLRGPLEHLPGLNVNQVADPGLGPVGALGIGIESAITGGQHSVLVLAVDVVEPCIALLQRFAAILVEDDHDVVLPMVEGHLQPLHAAWSTKAATVLAEAVEEGVLRLHDVLERLDVCVVERDGWADLDPDARFVRDVDVPADLALLR
jgi:molybdopterin-guanine dinucleotide biosynthesis protein A